MKTFGGFTVTYELGSIATI